MLHDGHKRQDWVFFKAEIKFKSFNFSAFEMTQQFSKQTKS
jgi:hypothetical protein